MRNRVQKSMQFNAYLIVALLFFRTLVGGQALASSKTEAIIEKEISRIFEGRLDRRLFIAFVNVNNKKDESSEKSNLEYIPFSVDNEFFDKKNLSLLDEDISYSEISFTINIVFDEKVSNTTADVLKQTITTRFLVDNDKRKIDISRGKLYAPENEIKSSSQLENERMIDEIRRIEQELNKKESNLQASQASVQDKIEKQIQEFQTKIGGTELIRIAKDFQAAVISLLIVIAIIVAFRFSSSSFKLGMGLVADGVKNGASNLGEALASAINPKREEQEATQDSTSPNVRNEKTPEIPQDLNWKDGNRDFDLYIKTIQEKIEVLTRDRNFSFIRQFVDLIENDTSLPLAASLLMALPPELGQQLVKDIAGIHVRRIHRYLESPGGLASAKAQRGKALQEFYGRIAMDEFNNSPLTRAKNLETLTRMTSEDMSNVLVKMPENFRSSFLACMSISRTKSILSAAKDVSAKDAVIKALAEIEKVDKQQLELFINYVNENANIFQVSRENDSILDASHHLATLVADLETDQDEIISKIISQNPNLQSVLYRYYLPFSTITRVQKQWVVQIFEPRSKSQVALALFDADSKIREYVITSLPAIKAEAIKDELRQLDDDKNLAAKNRLNSRKIQKSISSQILTLVNNQTIELIPENSDGDKSEKISNAA